MGLSIGKIRGLQRISDPGGIFTICAMDHRGSLEGKICPGLTASSCREEMTDFKLDLCRILSPFASAVLLDPVYGAAQAVSQGLPGRGTGLLVSLEKTGYSGSAEARLTGLLPGWSVAKIKRMAADAVKLLVYYRPDVEDVASKQRELVGKVADECRRYDLPCVVEAVSYPIGREATDIELFIRRKPDIVIQTARDLTALPIDVLKSEFPADLSVHGRKEAAELCRKLDAASSKPWVILSAGADYETFSSQVALACRAGASGYLAGRAIWQEATNMNGVSRRGFFSTVGIARLKKIARVARQNATSWQKRLGLSSDDIPPVEDEWYKKYSE
jgi:tagatose 1,6-diphosphate aldolase